MKIVIIGGHLTPALSVIEQLPKDCEILYIGRVHALEGDSVQSLEYTTITGKGIPFVDLKTGRLQRKLTKHTIPSITKIPYGFVQSMKTLREFKPDAVVGFGGYVSFPVILAARTLRIPIVIHEQTLEAGATNKAVAKFVDKVCISFETSRKYFPKEKVILTGNPIRKTILTPEKKFENPSQDPIIYITGGSLGSHFINLMVSGSLSSLLEKAVVVHQSGGSEEFNDFDKLSILKEGLNNNKRNRYILSKFFSPEEIGGILKASTLVVGRGGINSVSELIVLKKPALLIPLPTTQRNEQMKNAQFFEQTGLGETQQQKNLTPELFSAKALYMIENIDRYKLTGSVNKFPKNAGEKIVKVIYEIRANRN